MSVDIALLCQGEAMQLVVSIGSQYSKRNPEHFLIERSTEAGLVLLTVLKEFFSFFHTKLRVGQSGAPQPGTYRMSFETSRPISTTQTAIKATQRSL